MNITQLFETLKSSKLEYCCLNGYHNIYASGSCHLHFLVTSRRSFVALLNLVPEPSGEKTKVAFTNTDNPLYKFYVYQKGEGLLPERLETKILASAVVHSDHGVIRPNYECQFAIAVYRMLVYRELELTIEERRILKQYISQTIGEVPKCKVNHSYFASIATSS